MNLSTSDIQAILFDLDGVIVDSEPLHVKALELTCVRFGFILLPEDILRFKGITEEQVAHHFIKDGKKAALTREEFIAYKSELYTRLVAEELVLVEGVLEFMQFCRAQSWRLGLTTSALPENAASVLQKFQLAHNFDAIVTGGDIAHSKPHPEPYLKTAQKLEVPPDACLVIEDSLNGVRSGKSAGCRVLGITTSFSTQELAAAGADWVVATFAEARRLFGANMPNAVLDPFPVIIQTNVAWGEMDAFQHVNNIVYFRYFESGRMAYFERINFADPEANHGIGPILAHTQCRFRKALTYPDTISIGVRVEEIKADRFTMALAIFSHRLQKIAAEGTAEIVAFDYRENRKAPLPPAVRMKIEELESSRAG